MVCLQGSVLSLEDIKELKRFLEALPRSSFFYEERYGRWGVSKIQPPSHRYTNPHDSWFPVRFDGDGEVLDEAMTTQYRNCHQLKALQKVVRVALRWMCRELHWHNQTRQMGMSIMQHYNLKKGDATKPLAWHTDNSDYTLVILLDDEKKWSGGFFLFRKRNEKDSCFIPRQGDGVLFDNRGTEHRLESLQAIEDNVCRTILTLHEKTSLGELRSTSLKSHAT